MSDTDETAIRAFATQIAAQLDETHEGPVKYIIKLVFRFGPARIQKLYDKAVVRHAAGDMLTRAGVPRTVGGVFFRLGRRLRGGALRRPRPPRIPRPVPPPVARPVFAWDERLPLVAGLAAQEGAVFEVKVTLIGRPGATVQHKDCVLTTFQPTRGPTLPRGLPTPPLPPMRYVVYMALAHWQAVVTRLDDPDTVLVIDGWATYDPALQGLAMFAMHVRAELSQTARNRQGGTV